MVAAQNSRELLDVESKPKACELHQTGVVFLLEESNKLRGDGPNYIASYMPSR